MTKGEAYKELLSELERVHYLGSALSLLGWDERVNLPKKSVEHRAGELAALAAVHHREFTKPRIGELLDTLERDLDPSSPEQECVVREARRDYDREVKLPEAFVARQASLESRAHSAWVSARAENDYAKFAPLLQEQIDTCKEEASYLACGGELAYDYFIDKHDPGVTTAIVEKLFGDLKKELVPLADEIIESPVQANTEMFRGFPVDKQESFLRKVVKQIGFDFDHGRIDVAVHPFCGGSGLDTRMTTRYFEDNPLDSLTSAIHETGHALYEQGLPPSPLGTGLTSAVGMAVHESQSRMWENQVGRSRAFWDYWEPQYRENFAKQLDGISFDELYLAINAVRRLPIRVDSDEVTYNLHIILRFELEKRLFDGSLSVPDLPDAWNQLSEEIVGLRPKNDTDGVLQDIHWSGGAFGYFPSYCLGNMIAAQLWYTIKEQMPDIEDDFRQGSFTRLLEWLRGNIHAHGRRYDTVQLVQRVTGSDLSPDCLMRYLRERYLPLFRP